MELQLRFIRDKRGLSIKQMYQRMGVKDSRYRKWESGSAAMPLEYAAIASDILHCSLDEMAGRVAPSLSDDERRLLDLYRDTNDQGKRAIMSVAEASRGVEGQAQDYLTHGASA